MWEGIAAAGTVPAWWRAWWVSAALAVSDLRQWCHHDVGGAIAVRAFELQHDIAGAVELAPFIGDGGAGNIAAQLFEFIALIHGAAHFGVEAESLRVGTALLGRLRIKAGDRLQRQYFLPCPGCEGDMAGATMYTFTLARCSPLPSSNSIRSTGLPTVQGCPHIASLIFIGTRARSTARCPV